MKNDFLFPISASAGVQSNKAGANVYSSNSSTTTTAGYNTAIGYQALGSNTSGS